MLRLLSLVLPIALVVSACSSPPARVSSLSQPGLTKGLTMNAPSASPGSADVFADDSSTADIELQGPGGASAPVTREDPDDDGFFDRMSDRHVTLLGGERWLTDNDWDPVDDQYALGVEVDGSDPDTGHGYELGMAFSKDEGHSGSTDGTGRTFDIYGGYRHTFRPDDSELHPYLSAGLAWIRGDIHSEGPNNDGDDNSAGAYLRAGIGYDVGDNVRLGLDYRHMFLTDMNIGRIGNADFDQLMLTLGIPF